jgi:hypothetical protein
LFNEYKRRIILGRHHFQTTTITAVISSDNTTKKKGIWKTISAGSTKNKKEEETEWYQLAETYRTLERK